MDKIQSQYNAYLCEAISRVGNEYYKIKTTYGETVRERVFCYEFYHQLRTLQKKFNLNELSLSAEIDKRGHQEIITDEQRNPDLIFHRYGEFESNEIIIEVKGNINIRGIKKDFETLNIYTNNYEYKYAYFILYNYNLKSFIQTFILALSKQEQKALMKNEKIVILCKRDYDSTCEIFKLSDLFM